MNKSRSRPLRRHPLAKRSLTLWLFFFPSDLFYLFEVEGEQQSAARRLGQSAKNRAERKKKSNTRVPTVAVFASVIKKNESEGHMTRRVQKTRWNQRRRPRCRPCCLIVFAVIYDFG